MTAKDEKPAKRLSQVAVEGLFGRFDFRFALNHQDRVTILHGPNGCGKTTILRLIDAALNARIEQLLKMPCKSLRLAFDDQSALKFSPRRTTADAKDGDVLPAGMSVRVSIDGKSGEIAPIPEELRERVWRMSHRLSPAIERIAEDRWINTRTRETFSLDELVLRYGDHFPPMVQKALKESGGITKQRYEEAIANINAYVIDTQRLISTRDEEVAEEEYPFEVRRRIRDTPTTPAVIAYSKRLSRVLAEHLRRYGVKASELDRTLPKRILTGRKVRIGESALRDRYDRVIARRREIVDAGLLSEKKEVELAFPSKTLDPSTKHVLRIYLDDMDQKLGVFDGMVERIRLFTDMINGLFSHKRIEVSPDYGFQFRTKEGDVLSPTMLSSGEQHQLVLLFDLLFGVPEHALILVDEPEISLHVSWQQQVIKNFRAISELRDLDFLIATHSPEVVFDRWDLTVELSEAQSGAR